MLPSTDPGTRFRSTRVRRAARVLLASLSIAIVAVAQPLSIVGADDAGTTAQGGSTINIDGSQLHQVMDGFGINLNVNAWAVGELRPALDRLVDEVGASLFRVYIDDTDWEATNDNADPFVFDWDYYTGVYTSPRLEELWGTLAYLNQKGVTSGIILSFMGPVPAWMGGAQIDTTAEDEWVEMISSLVYYAKVTRNLQFTRLAPLNEPNWDCKEGPCVDQFQAPRLLEKLAQRLDALGLTDIRLVGPETAAGSGYANAYISELLANPVVMSHLDLFAYHSYAGDSAATDALIRGSAYPDRRWWISEQMLGNAEGLDWVGFLMTHLRDGASAAMAFKGYDNQDNHHVPPGDFDYGLLAYDPTNRTYSPRKSFYAMAQVCKFVGSGARRIGATSSSSAVQVVAFYDSARSRLTIIGWTPTFGVGGTFSGTLTGLPPVSSLQVYQTDTFSTNMQRGADVAVTNGDFSVQVPGATIFTLTATLAVDAAPPSVAVTAPLAGATVSGTVTLTASASDDVGVTGVQFLVDDVAVGAEAVGVEDATAPYSTTWNTTVPGNGSHSITARARDAAGNAATSVAVSVTVTNTVTPPTGSPSPAVDRTVFSQGIGTRTTPAFSTAGSGERLVAFVMSDGPAAINSQTMTVTGAGLTWTRLQRAAATHGDAEIWTAAAASLLNNVSVTSTPSAGGFYQSLFVVAFTGVSDIGASNVSGAMTGAPAVSLVAQAAGSLVYAVGTDWDRAMARTIPAGQTMAYEYLAPAGDTFWVQSANTTTAVAGATVTLNSTAPANDQWNLAIVELKPVAPVKQPPAANPQNVTTDEDVPRPVTLTGTDPDTASLTFSIVASPTHGAIGGTAPNLTYTPGANYNGPDSFTFRANDGELDSTVATVSVTVTAVNDAPVAADQVVSTAEDTAKIVALSASDFDSSALTYSIVAGPTHGALGGTAPNLTYTPGANYSGPDSFTFKANDGKLDSTVATISVTVNSVGTGPAVQLLSPNGGDKLLSGSAFLTRWNATAGTTVLSSFSVQYSTNNGTSFVAVPGCSGLGAAIRQCTWASPVATTAGRVRVIATDAAVRTGSDDSDTTFSVVAGTASVSVTSPTASTTWATGSVKPITWSHNIGTATFAATFTVEISRNGTSGPWQAIASAVPQLTATTGSLVWTVVGPASTRVRFRVRPSNFTVQGTSGLDISIAVQSVTLLAPAAGATVAGVVTVSATTADNAAVAGMQFMLDGVAFGTEDTVAPFSVAWTTTTMINGARSLTARARDAAGNATMSAPVTVTVSNAAPPGPAVDQTVVSEGVGTRTTPAFTTASPGEVLVAFAMSDGPARVNGQTVTVTGAGLTWTRVRRAATRYGDAEIWTATATTVLTNVTVTSTPSAGGFAQSLTVITFTGASGVGASKIAGAVTGAPTVSLVAQGAGSVVYGVGNDWDGAVTRTIPSDQTKVYEFLAPIGDTFWVQAANARPAAGATVTLNATAPTNHQWNFAIVELKR